MSTFLRNAFTIRVSTVFSHMMSMYVIGFSWPIRSILASDRDWETQIMGEELKEWI